MPKVRVPVIGTVGRAIRINSDATVGSQIGTNFQLPDGSVPSLVELARVLQAIPPPDFIPGAGPWPGFVFETEVIDGDLLARVADDEIITGAWQFDGITNFNANVRINGATFNIFDASGADSLAASHDGVDFDFAFTGTQQVQFTGAVASYQFDKGVAIVASSPQPFSTFSSATSVTAQLFPASLEQSGAGAGTFVVSGMTSFRFLGGTDVRIYHSGGVDHAALSHDGTDFLFAFINTLDVNFTGATNYQFDNSVFINEKGTANADEAGKGQFWTADHAPNSPRFTSDTGVDFTLNNVMEFEYGYNSAVTAADPGAGTLRFDSVTIGSITKLYIDDLAGTGQDNAWILSNLATDDIIVIKSEADDADYIVAAVASTPTDNTGWWTIPLTLIHTGTIFSNTDRLRLSVQWMSSLSTTFTLGDLADVEVIGAAQDDLLVLGSGGIWTDTNGALTWDSGGVGELSIVGNLFLSGNQIIADGGSLTIRDPANSDTVVLSHDGTFAKTQYVNTLRHHYLDGADPRWFDSTNTHFWGWGIGPNSVLFEGSATINSLQFETDGDLYHTLFLDTALGGHTIFKGGALQLRDSTNADFIDIVHDGVDVNFTHANTANWNISGITAILAGTVDADFDAITGTSIATGLGTEALPSRSFEGDPDTGDFSPGANIYAITVGGTEAVRYTGASAPLIRTGMNSGIIASTTQTQAGATPLTASWNEVAVVANNNDAVLLPAMVKGEMCVVINNSTKKLQVFPALGKDCGAGIDTSVTIKGISSRYWFHYDNTVAFDIATDFKNLQGVDTIGVSANDLLHFDGANWKHTGGDLTWDGVTLTAVRIKPIKYLQHRTASTANLEDITNAVNTSGGKIQGAEVYNRDTDNPVYATGPSDGSVWVNGIGTTVHTPV